MIRQRSLFDSRWAIALGVVTVAAVLFAVGMFLTGRDVTKSTPGQATVEASQGTIEDSLEVKARFSWSAAGRFDVLASGRVTGSVSGEVVREGDSILLIDERPVTALTGTVPVYRDLTEGVRGEDVRQLQDFLSRHTLSLSVDGVFGSSTSRAVQRWNSSRGCACGSSVPAGSIVFVPELPTRMRAADGLRLGAPVPSPALEVVGLQPSVSVTVQAGEAARIPAGAVVRVALPAGDVQGKVAAAGMDDGKGGVVFPVVLDHADCQAAKCPPPSSAEGASTVPAVLTVVPKTSGVLVPAGSVGVAADGGAFVTLPDGKRVVVTLGATARGLIVVRGVQSGTRILAQAR